MAGEIYFFGISVLSGIAATIIFDFFRAMRKISEPQTGKVAFEDILFWVSEAVFVFFVLYKYNSGGVRFYFFLGLMIGAILYLFALSRYVIKIFSALIYTFKITVQKIFLILRKITGLFMRPFKWFFGEFSKIFLKSAKNLKKIKKQLKMY